MIGPVAVPDHASGEFDTRQPEKTCDRKIGTASTERPDTRVSVAWKIIRGATPNTPKGAEHCAKKKTNVREAIAKKYPRWKIYKPAPNKAGRVLTTRNKMLWTFARAMPRLAETGCKSNGRGRLELAARATAMAGQDRPQNRPRLAKLGHSDSNISHSSTLKFFKNGNLRRPQTPVLGKIEICAIWISCRKFNSEQLLYEATFNLIYSFCNILPKMNAYLLI